MYQQCWLDLKSCTSLAHFICVIGFLNEIILGTVIVQPEPVLNEDKDDSKGPEFRSRSKMKCRILSKQLTQMPHGGKL